MYHFIDSELYGIKICYGQFIYRSHYIGHVSFSDDGREESINC